MNQEKTAGLTDQMIRAASTTGKEVSLRDAGPWKGLVLRISRRGVKSFCYEYRRKPDGKPKRLTLGRYGTGPTELTLANARIEMRKAITSAPSGDPQGEKMAARAEAKRERMTVAELFEQWNEGLANRQRGWGANSKRLYEQYIAPFKVEGTKVADMVVADLKRPHVHRILDHAHRQARTCKRDGRYCEGNGARNQTLAVISAMLNFGIDRGDYGITSNEAARIKHLPGNARENYLKREQLGAFWQAVGKLEEVDEREAVQLCVLWGQRSIQIRRLDWSWVDFEVDNPRVEYPSRSMKARNRHVLGLPDRPGLALGILKARWQRMGKPRSGPVFPTLSRHDGTGYQKMRRAQIAVAAAIGEDDSNLHDWRRAINNHTRRKVSGDQRSLILGHVERSTRKKHYEDEAGPDDTRPTLAIWESIIVAAADPNKVVAFQPSLAIEGREPPTAADVVTLRQGSRRPRQKPARTVKRAERG